MKERMVYSANKPFLMSFIEEQLGRPIDVRLEAEMPSEISFRDVDNIIHPPTLNTTTFARPKAPRRK